MESSWIGLHIGASFTDDYDEHFMIGYSYNGFCVFGFVNAVYGRTNTIWLRPNNTKNITRSPKLSLILWCMYDNAHEIVRYTTKKKESPI